MVLPAGDLTVFPGPSRFDFKSLLSDEKKPPKLRYMGTTNKKTCATYKNLFFQGELFGWQHEGQATVGAQQSVGGDYCVR